MNEITRLLFKQFQEEQITQMLIDFLERNLREDDVNHAYFSEFKIIDILDTLFIITNFDILPFEKTLIRNIVKTRIKKKVVFCEEARTTFTTYARILTLLNEEDLLHTKILKDYEQDVIYIVRNKQEYKKLNIHEIDDSEALILIVSLFY